MIRSAIRKVKVAVYRQLILGQALDDAVFEKQPRIVRAEISNELHDPAKFSAELLKRGPIAVELIQDVNNVQLQRR